MRLLRRGRRKPHSPEPGTPVPGTTGSVKKLSQNATPHIPKETTPVGGTNAQGQKRYIDPTSGKDHYADMKVGKVMGPRGIPVNG